MTNDQFYDKLEKLHHELFDLLETYDPGKTKNLDPEYHYSLRKDLRRIEREIARLRFFRNFESCLS